MRKTSPSAFTSSESKYGDFSTISWTFPVLDGMGGASLPLLQLCGYQSQSGRHVRERGVLVFVRVRSRKVAVRAARLGCLAIHNGAKLVAGVASVLRSPSLSVASSLQIVQRGLTCEAT